MVDDGTIFWADLGLGISDDVGPLDAGTVRRYDPASGSSSTMDEGLDFPDGIGIFRP